MSPILKVGPAFLILLSVAVPRALAVESSPLAPVKTESPRDTMRSFMKAMNDYRKGVATKDDELQARLWDAVRTLNLSEVPAVLRQETGQEAAVFLKEVIDRVIRIDYSKIPEALEDPRWRLKDTEIVISKATFEGREGEWLFSPATVARARGFYHQVKHLPYLPGTGKGALYEEPWLERKVPGWAREEIVFFPNWKWLGLFLTILLGLAIRTLTKFFLNHYKRLSARFFSVKWKDRVIGAIENPVALVAMSAFWFFSVHLLSFEGTALLVLMVTIEVLFSIGIIWTIYRLADVLTAYLRDVAARSDSVLDDQLVPLIHKSMKVFILVLGVLITIQNLGYNVMSLLAGLGLGGLAFALAAKDTAANLFGSIMILVDRPFTVGDWIVVDGGGEGTVTEIGFRSTRIRTFYNSEVSIPNSVVANARIDNMGRREFRRVKATLGVTYDTPPEKIEAFLEGIKNIIKANPYTRKDYYHVVFSEYGDFNLGILVYFFLKVPDWSTELVERQNVYIEILRLAHDLEVEFAFPTQTLHVDTFPEKKPVRPPHEVDRERLSASAREFGPDGKASRPEGLGLFVPPYKETT